MFTSVVYDIGWSPALPLHLQYCQEMCDRFVNFQLVITFKSKNICSQSRLISYMNTMSCYRKHICEKNALVLLP